VACVGLRTRRERTPGSPTARVPPQSWSPVFRAISPLAGKGDEDLFSSTRSPGKHGVLKGPAVSVRVSPRDRGTVKSLLLSPQVRQVIASGPVPSQGRPVLTMPQRTCSLGLEETYPASRNA
jgi:hypothetical protein